VTDGLAPPPGCAADLASSRLAREACVQIGSLVLRTMRIDSDPGTGKDLRQYAGRM
jgi:hypothetical protein